MERLPPRATLRLIGAPSLQDGGSPIRLARRKSLALLAFLALEKGPHGRDSLAALFWPDCDQKRAHGNLRSSIFDLSNALGGDRFHPLQDRIELDGSMLGVDVLDFEELARPCPGHGSDRTCPLCSNRLEEAGRAWANPRAGFMDGFTLQGSCDFDDWQFSWRERLREELRSVLRRVALAKRLSGDFTGAWSWAERWLEASPLDGEAWRLEVRLLLGEGKRDKALERYRIWAETSLRGLGYPLRESFEQLAGEERRQGPAEAGSPSPAGRARGGMCREAPSPGELVGRAGELAIIGGLLDGQGSRLVTIRGTGGLGKTVLAKAVLAGKGREYAGGAFFVDLSSLRDPSLLPLAIAEAIGMAFDGKARSGIAERLRDRLAARPSLLVLDNFEQLLEARGFVEKLIGDCPRLAVLVTSREALGLGIETVFDPPPLTAPPVEAEILPGELASWPALDLITRRALAANPGFELSERNLRDCATLCARLDGLPLALELAASRFGALEPGELVERLDRKLDLLAAREADRPARHRTLRAVIDWSYELLSQPEQEMFSGLGLFPESFDLDAMEAILGADGPAKARPSLIDSLASLISKSLLRRRCESGKARYFFPEALREYARSRLEGDPRKTELEMRHAFHYLDLARTKSRELSGRGQKEAFQALGLERYNFRAAFSSFLDSGRACEAMELCSCLAWFWYRAGQYDWGRWAMEKCLGLEGAADKAALRGSCLRALGWLCFVQGGWREAEERYLSALPLLEGGGKDRELVRCLSDLGVVQRWLGRREDGNAACARAIAIARGTGDSGLIAQALVWYYGTTGGRRVDEDQEAGLEEAARLARSAGDDWTEAHAFESLGDYLREEGRHGEAGACFEEAVRGFTAADDEWLLAWAFEGRGMNALLSGDRRKAAALLGETAARFARLGDPGGCAYALGELGLALCAAGSGADADRLLGAACAIVAGTGEERGGAARTGCCSEELGTRARGLAWSGDGRLGEAIAEAAARDSEAWREGRRLSLEAALRLAAEAASG